MRRLTTLFVLVFALPSVAFAQDAAPKGGGPAPKAPAAPEPGAAPAADESPAPEPPAPPTAEQRDAARVAYGEGQTLFSEEKYEESAAAFQRAFEAVPNPIVLKSLGECYAKLGRLVDAVTTLEKYLNLSPDAGAEDRSAIEARITELKSTPAVLVVTSDPPGARVLVDGEEPGKPTPAEFSVAGGEHKIEVSLEGYQPIEDVVSPAFGARHEVEVKLTKLPPPPAVVEEQLAPVEEPAPPEPPTATLWLTGVVGAAGLVTGSVLGFMALSEKSDFDAKPSTKAADDGERLALFADVAFGVGAMAIITGAVLYFTWDDQPQPETSAKSRPLVKVTPIVTPEVAAVSTEVRF